MDNNKSIAQVLSKISQSKIFLQLAKETSVYTHLLNHDAQLSVFVPVNAAFESSVIEELNNNPEKREQFVKSHILCETTWIEEYPDIADCTLFNFNDIPTTIKKNKFENLYTINNVKILLNSSQKPFSLFANSSYICFIQKTL